jgi:heme ABC exporter ATP-binding subunit CcmA
MVVGRGLPAWSSPARLVVASPSSAAPSSRARRRQRVASASSEVGGGEPVAVVAIRSAVCVLGGFPALAGVDLDVVEGEVLLLSGPNGAGKTTLLRVVAGLVPLRQGSVTVFGHDLAVDRTSHRGAVAVVGHDTFGYDDLTVRENLRFAAAAAGRPRAAADAALDAVGLEAVAGTRHGRLSAGQRRRVSLGTALARDARLLLLDEPHAGLDASGRALLDDVVRRAPSEGRTVVLASHELDLARGVATREAEVVGGRVRGGLVAPSDTPASDTPPPTVETTEVGA